MKSHDQLRDQANLIGAILYDNSFQGKSFIIHPSFNLPNLLD